MYSTGDVSIIIAVHCHEPQQVKWFGECLESAKTQGCPIVIVDDASTVSIHETVANSWQEGMHYHRLPTNEGVSAARNRAVSLSTTPLIIPLDGDDTFRDGAIRSLLEAYSGIPLYPDISLFGLEVVEHYQLMNFSCSLLYEKVGISTVNVLHSKEQWKTVGGWKEDILFYEDGEYNARLMLTYCGKRYPFPLVNYRIHPYQRTQKYKNIEAQQARSILSIIQEYKDMSCCGGKRRQSAQNSGVAATAVKGVSMTTNVSELPGTQGDMVLAQYIGGKGAGKHYYRGAVTKYPYKVKYGEYYYVDPRDTKEVDDRLSHNLFVHIVKEEPEVVQEEVVEEVRTPKKTPKKEPVLYKETQPDPDLPDIHNLRWQQEIRNMEFSPAQAKQLHEIESNGKKRKKVLAHLKKQM